MHMTATAATGTAKFPNSSCLFFLNYHLLHRDIPYIGPYIQAPFKEYLANQKKKLHRQPGQGTAVSRAVLSSAVVS